MMESSCCLVVKLAWKAIAVARKEEQRLLLVEDQRKFFGNLLKETTSEARQRLGELRSASDSMQPYDARKKHISNFLENFPLPELQAAAKKALVEGHHIIYNSWTVNSRPLVDVLEEITEALKHNKVHMQNFTEKHHTCTSMFHFLFIEILKTAEWLKYGTVILQKLVRDKKLIILYEQWIKHLDNFDAEFSRYPIPQHIIPTRPSPRPANEANHVADLIGKPTGGHLCWKCTFDHKPQSNEARPKVNKGQKPPVFTKFGKIDHIYQRHRPMSEGYHMQLVQQPRQIGQGNRQTVQKKEQVLQQPVQSVQTGQQSSDIGQVYQQGGLVGKQLRNRRSATRLVTYPELSPNGNGEYFASGGADHKIIVWRSNFDREELRKKTPVKALQESQLKLDAPVSVQVDARSSASGSNMPDIDVTNVDVPHVVTLDINSDEGIGGDENIPQIGRRSAYGLVPARQSARPKPNSVHTVCSSPPGTLAVDRGLLVAPVGFGSELVDKVESLVKEVTLLKATIDELLREQKLQAAD